MNHRLRTAVSLLASFAWSNTGLSYIAVARPASQQSPKQPAGKSIIEHSLDTYDKASSIQAVIRISLNEKSGKKNGFVRVLTKMENAPSGTVARSVVEVEENQPGATTGDSQEADGRLSMMAGSSSPSTPTKKRSLRRVTAQIAFPTYSAGFYVVFL